MLDEPTISENASYAARCRTSDRRVAKDPVAPGLRRLRRQCETTRHRIPTGRPAHSAWAPRSRNCRRHGQSRERCNRTPPVRRTRLSLGQPETHAEGKTRKRRNQGKLGTARRGWFGRACRISDRTRTIQLPWRERKSIAPHASTYSPTQACLRLPPFLRRKAFRLKIAGRGPSTTSR